MIYKFDVFELDEERFELRGPNGEIVRLQTRALELLLLLIRHASLLVTKDMISRKFGAA